MRRLPLLLPALSLLAATFAPPARADEGMWQPAQLPDLEVQLKARGLDIEPEELASLTEHPMGAVVSLGGCTASFVSPEGLVVTNHHCAYGAIQYNSTADNNLLVNGFLAADHAGELPVNFLADLDITGGNSGSPTLNGRGELVGLAFDGNIESVSASWIFQPAITRSIHVDVRYMLWVMATLDSAGHLLEEMGVDER